MVTPLTSLGDHPQFIDCPFCNRRAQTRLSKKGGSMQMYDAKLYIPKCCQAYTRYSANCCAVLSVLSSVCSVSASHACPASCTGARIPNTIALIATKNSRFEHTTGGCRCSARLSRAERPSLPSQKCNKQRITIDWIQLAAGSSMPCC